MASSEVKNPSLSWKNVVESKRSVRLQAVAPYLELEIPRTDPITEISDVDELSRMIQSRELSAEEVILAYINR